MGRNWKSTLLVAVSLCADVMSQSLYSNGSWKYSNDTSIGFIQSLPECATTCFSTLLESASCSLETQELLADCLCPNIALRRDLLSCSQSSCGLLDVIPALLAEDEVCASFPKESRADLAMTAAILTFAISVPALIARCVSRLKYSQKLWSDDYMAIAATIFLLGLASMQIVCCQNGFGLHQWETETIENSELLLQIFYILVACIAKLSILLLYQRIFSTGASRWFRWSVKGLIVLSFVIGTLFTFLILFQCYPIAAAWDITITDFKCYDFAPLLFAGSFMVLITDIILVILPIPELRKLQINGRKRAGVGIMFAIALLGCVASAVRLQYLVRLNWSYDLSWDETDVVVWSLIEMLCIVVCGNLPALRPFLGEMIPRLAATWQRSARSLKRSTFSSSRYSNGTIIENDDAKALSSRVGVRPVYLHRLNSVSTEVERSELPEGYAALAWPEKSRLPAGRF